MYHRGMLGRTGIVIGVVVLLASVLAVLVWSSMSLARHTGEVCITYRGRTDCRSASGTTREEAQRAATDMACSSLASGMTDRINCQDTPPSRVTWQE